MVSLEERRWKTFSHFSYDTGRQWHTDIFSKVSPTPSHELSVGNISVTPEMRHIYGYFNDRSCYKEFECTILTIAIKVGSTVARVCGN